MDFSSRGFSKCMLHSEMGRGIALVTWVLGPLLIHSGGEHEWGVMSHVGDRAEEIREQDGTRPAGALPGCDHCSVTQWMSAHVDFPRDRGLRQPPPNAKTNCKIFKTKVSKWKPLEIVSVTHPTCTDKERPKFGNFSRIYCLCLPAHLSKIKLLRII